MHTKHNPQAKHMSAQKPFQDTLKHKVHTKTQTPTLMRTPLTPPSHTLTHTSARTYEHANTRPQHIHARAAHNIYRPQHEKLAFSLSEPLFCLAQTFAVLCIRRLLLPPQDHHFQVSARQPPTTSQHYDRRGAPLATASYNPLQQTPFFLSSLLPQPYPTEHITPA
jgi:hypothetical protein